MSKIYKGYELIKAIADGKIKEGDSIEVHDLSVVDKLVTTIIINRDKAIVWKTGEFDTSMLSNEYYYFKLKENEIDIQDIGNIGIIDFNNDDDRLKLILTISNLVDAVKQLDNKINK